MKIKHGKYAKYAKLLNMLNKPAFSRQILISLSTSFSRYVEQNIIQ